jgi:hypothetical protein
MGTLTGGACIAEVMFDSERLPIALLVVCQFVDSGHHIVRAVRGSQVITGEIDILEGQHKIATLSFLVVSRRAR